LDKFDKESRKAPSETNMQDLNKLIQTFSDWSLDIIDTVLSYVKDMSQLISIPLIEDAIPNLIHNFIYQIFIFHVYVHSNYPDHPANVNYKLLSIY
jgi:hypothetical protein